MGCCESDMHVRETQFRAVPFDPNERHRQRSDPYAEEFHHGPIHDDSMQQQQPRYGSDIYDDTSVDPYGTPNSAGSRRRGGGGDDSSVRSRGRTFEGGPYDEYLYNENGRTPHREGGSAVSARGIVKRTSSRQNTPRAFASTDYPSKGGDSSAHRTISRQSSFFEGDDEMILVCADCGAEVFDTSATPARCPKTGKVHS